MVVFVYRWRLVPGKEDVYRAAWRKVTLGIRETQGGLGSRLHRAADGTWLAYAQWPSVEARERARAMGSPDPAASEAMRGCIAERFDELVLEVVDDLLPMQS
ncbi:MAG: antibiotic biosynthesis monooxygenase [Deltaproteobacteria bacterium]|nr:antibiotic biosynthesis monooxygenase [Deltaproteobacteria bacterium]